VAKPKLTGAYSQMQKDMGSRIRWARQLVEPNRAAFARKLQVDRTTLHKIEDGDRAPSVFLVAELSHKLLVSTDYIILGTLRGVDGEMAAKLLEAHPELRDHRGTDGPVSNGGDSSPRPRRRGQAS
jgi:DNA-binding XRE family transcriptional regulator